MTKPQETIDFTLNKRTDTFSFCPLINLTEEGKWLLAFASFEAIDSVFNITDGNNSVSKTTADHWMLKRVEVTLDKLRNLIELTSKTDNELHLKKN